ncbi:MAG: hypothetical protein GX567_01800, partial [Clostridia bacterium]|nr:hypothetical protein [Clostridia bacterium]
MNNPYSRGSEWRKWDLQVQTILDDNYVSLDQYWTTIKSNNPAAWETYVAKVGGEDKALLYDSKAYFTDHAITKDERCLNYVRNFLAYIESFDPALECIGITDHNYFDDHLLDAFIGYSWKSHCKIIPGVEVNCTGIHMIILFPNILYGKDTFSEGIQAFLIKFNINTRTTAGVLTTTTSDIKKIIDEVNKNDGIVIYPHCNSDNGLFQERTKTDRTHLADIYNYQKINLLQSQNKQSCEAVADYIKTNTNLRSRFCFHIGSDSRSLKDVGKPDKDGNYLWIKADPTFNGLKQIICEPEERVYVGRSISKSKNDANVIDKVVIKNSNRWFEEEPILLNENLVTIIGEKGAGKTALADMIALAAGDFDIETANESGSFVT